MSVTHRICVQPLPRWLEPARLLGPGEWDLQDTPSGAVSATAELLAAEAADLCARLRGVSLAGSALSVDVAPPLSRALIRAGRVAEARRLRQRGAGFERPGARCDDEGRWSLTPEIIALELGRQARGCSVLDAGCGVGGNAIGFARAGCTVTAVDCSAERLALARHNAALYGVAERIAFVQGDALAWVQRAQAQLLFVDPPWGRDYDKRRVVLSDLPLLEALLQSRARFGAVWAKVPPSFDPGSVSAALPEAWFGCGVGDARRVKFVLLRW